jgi:hypothetical protein
MHRILLDEVYSGTIPTDNLETSLGIFCKPYGLKFHLKGSSVVIFKP